MAIGDLDPVFQMNINKFYGWELRNLFTEETLKLTFFFSPLDQSCRFLKWRRGPKLGCLSTLNVYPLD